jgi:hypothetical protein
MIVHNHEHLGQTMAYARLNGITPPWTEEAQKEGQGRQGRLRSPKGLSPITAFSGAAKPLQSSMKTGLWLLFPQLPQGCGKL